MDTTRYADKLATAKLASFMSTYLLTCNCRTAVPVEVGQAGGKIVCPACGAQLDVPPLRKLRHLPVALAVTERKSAPWGARQGFLTAGLILAAILAAVALWSRLSEPAIPKFDPDARLRSVDKALETMTPTETWQLWIEVYRPLAEKGFGVFSDPHTPAIKQHIAKQRFFQRTLLAVAAVCGIVALAAALWPRRSPRYFPA